MISDTVPIGLRRWLRCPWKPQIRHQVRARGSSRRLPVPKTGHTTATDRTTREVPLQRYNDAVPQKILPTGQARLQQDARRFFVYLQQELRSDQDCDFFKSASGTILFFLLCTD